MGNNRQQMKDNLQNDLQKKIRMAETVLTQLKTTIQSVEQNSTEAKCELENQVDSLQQIIAIRKLELNRDIDLLCNKQISTLQEEIRSTYIALGSLKSTLTHLDSFDHSQFVNLHVPDFSWMQNVTMPPPLEMKLDSSRLKEEVEQWGCVSAKGYNGWVDVGHASMPEIYGRPDRDFLCHKSVSESSCPSMALKVQPKFPLCKSTGESARCDVKIDHKVPQGPDSPDSEQWHVEQWLIKTDPCNDENDDFEFVAFGAANLVVRDAEDIKDNVSSVYEVELVTNAVEDEGSSIVCIERENAGQSVNELAQWLKPKITTVAPAREVQTPEPAPLITTSVPISNKRTSPIDNRFIDFPCLRLDSTCWIKEKKHKVSMIPDLGFSFSQNEIIPPTYALPNPFWLKRLC